MQYSTVQYLYSNHFCRQRFSRPQWLLVDGLGRKEGRRHPDTSPTLKRKYCIIVLLYYPKYKAYTVLYSIRLQYQGLTQ